jgi:MFS family permease
LLGRRYLGGAAEGTLLLAALAAAALAATAATARWPLRPRPETVFMIATGIAGSALAALAFAGGAAWVIALAAVIGVADGPQLAAVFAVRQREAPARHRGQIFTTAASLKISAGALGAALAGTLAQHSVTLVLAAAAAAQAAALIACQGRPGSPVRRRTSRITRQNDRHARYLSPLNGLTPTPAGSPRAPGVRMRSSLSCPAPESDAAR